MTCNNYIITDGHRFVTVDSKGKQSTTSAKKLAERFSLEDGKQRLIKSGTLKGFYLEGGSPLCHITRKQILKELNKDIDNSGGNVTDRVERVSTYVNTLCEQISSIIVPERKSLMQDREFLQKEVTACETILFDIQHWIRAHRPPANIMAKVYVKQNYYEVRRESIKEKIRQLDVLIDEFSDESYSISTALKRLKDSKIHPYNPRTTVYAELDAFLK